MTDLCITRGHQVLREANTNTMYLASWVEPVSPQMAIKKTSDHFHHKTLIFFKDFFSFQLQINSQTIISGSPGSDL